jgi:molybdate transport system substrate-binding protein
MLYSISYLFVNQFSMRYLFISLCLLLASGDSMSQRVNIAAAADLRYAMDEILKEYKKHNPDADIIVSYGSSGKFYQQLLQGAPFDLFFSADMMYAQRLYAQGLTTAPPQIYALGYIVLWSSKLDVSRGLTSLLDPKIKRVAMANPAHAPYGQRADECLKYYRLYDKLKHKLVFGENIAQAAQFAQSGNAEAGIIALSLALAPSMLKTGKYFLIDEKSYSPLEQGFVMMKQSATNDQSARFVAFISGKVGRDIFRKYGFTYPDKK